MERDFSYVGQFEESTWEGAPNKQQISKYETRKYRNLNVGGWREEEAGVSSEPWDKVKIMGGCGRGNGVGVKLQYFTGLISALGEGKWGWNEASF